MNARLLIGASLMTLTLWGCSEAQPETKAVPPSGLAGSGDPKAALPAGHPPIGDQATKPNVPNLPASPGHSLGAPAPAAAEVTFTGTVVEAVDATSYTYLKVKTADAQEKWAAVLKLEVKAGQKIEVKQQMVMENFQSKTLNRTFEKIIFGTAKTVP